MNAITLSTEQGGRWLRLAGELNYATVDEVRDALLARVEAASDRAVIDLRDVRLVSSLGIELLLQCVRTGEAGAVVILLNESVQETLEMIGLATRLTVTTDGAEASRLAHLEAA